MIEWKNHYLWTSEAGLHKKIFTLYKGLRYFAKKKIVIFKYSLLFSASQYITNPSRLLNKCKITYNCMCLWFSVYLKVLFEYISSFD